MDPTQLQEMLEQLGSVGVTLPALTLGAGLLLLILGSKLARPMCTFSGLVLGGAGGLMIGEALADQGSVVMALVIGAAIAGALLSALLFRVWMAISGALIFGLTAAGVMLLLQAPPEETALSSLTDSTQTVETSDDTSEDGSITVDIPLEGITDAVKEGISTAIEGGASGSEDDASAQLTIDNETAKKIGASILEALRGMATYYWDQLKLWWGDAGGGARGAMLLVGLVAGVVGLLLGLVGPYKAASVQSAVAGSVLVLFSSFSLLAQLLPEQLHWLPATPRKVLLCLGLITAVGLALQWTIFKRKTDK